MLKKKMLSLRSYTTSLSSPPLHHSLTPITLDNTHAQPPPSLGFCEALKKNRRGSEESYKIRREMHDAFLLDQYIVRGLLGTFL